MLAPFVNKVHKTNSVIATIQIVGLLLFGGVIVQFYGPEFISSPPPIPRIVATASATDSLELLMDTKPIEERKSFYKLVKGVSEYCKNSTRVRDNVKVRDLIEEVILTYNLQEKVYFQENIDRAVTSAGILKDDNISASKEKVIIAFDELANSIKRSIEKYKEAK